jgi:hypothetical protein
MTKDAKPAIVIQHLQIADADLEALVDAGVAPK